MVFLWDIYWRRSHLIYARSVLIVAGRDVNFRHFYCRKITNSGYVASSKEPGSATVMPCSWSILTWISPITDFFHRNANSRASKMKPSNVVKAPEKGTSNCTKTIVTAPIYVDEESVVSRSSSRRRPSRQEALVFDSIEIIPPSRGDTPFSVQDSQPRDDDVPYF